MIKPRLVSDSVRKKWNVAVRILGIVVIILLTVNRPLTVTSQDNDTYISEVAYNACVEIGEMYGICPELLMAIIETESSGNPRAVNGNCKGLMQISVKWHQDRMDRLGVTDIYNEYGNILVGTDYLMELAGQYGDVSYVLDKYNGNSKADYNYENGILSEYAAKILERSAQLERIHGK